MVRVAMLLLAAGCWLRAGGGKGGAQRQKTRTPSERGAAGCREYNL
jgi:hypothetical protein